MRDMAHSICLMKLYQIAMRKKISIFVSDYLKTSFQGKIKITGSYPDDFGGNTHRGTR